MIQLIIAAIALLLAFVLLKNIFLSDESIGFKGFYSSKKMKKKLEL